MADDLDLARQAGASESDLEVIRQFKERAQDFALSEANLHKLGVAVARMGDAELEKEYGDLVARADWIRSKIQAVTQAIDNAIRTAKSILGLQGLNAVGQLGAWFIPIAVIVGAVAIIGYWLADYAKFVRKLQEREQIAADLVAQGVDPQAAELQASRAISESTRGGLFNVDFSSPIVIALLIGAGIWLYQRSR